MENMMNNGNGETEEMSPEEIREKMQRELEEMRTRSKEATQAMAEGKGRLRLETPILAGDKEITELSYDFTKLTGMEYIDAMDSDTSAQQIFRITYRQALALFAKAASKETPALDMQDILSRIGVTDTVKAVQLATLFFSASTRAGHQRISKKS